MLDHLHHTDHNGCNSLHLALEYGLDQNLCLELLAKVFNSTVDVAELRRSVAIKEDRAALRHFLTAYDSRQKRSYLHWIAASCTNSADFAAAGLPLPQDLVFQQLVTAAVQFLDTSELSNFLCHQDGTNGNTYFI